MGDIAGELIKELEVETVFSFKIAGYKIDVAESVVVTWIIMAVLILAAIILTRNLKVHNISKRQAVAEVLFGRVNPSGRLPITFYRNVDQLPDFEDYNMEGHTYRFFRGEPLYPFGYGLSYSKFVYGKPRFADGKLTLSVSNKRCP